MENKDEKNNNMLLILIIIILFISIFLILMASILGKIGYIPTSAGTSSLIVVSEGDIGWDLIQQLNIFDESKKIAPGDNGIYNFKISNTTNKKIIYDIQIREINKYNVNMKYKIKTEGQYVAGDENNSLLGKYINVESIILEPNSEKEYELQWKWEDAPNDTKVGVLTNAKYVVRIKIGAEIYNNQ